VERQAERDALRLEKAERRDEKARRAEAAGGQKAKEGLGERKRKVETDELMQELQARVPKGPRLSALDLDTHEKKGKKRRRKKRGRSKKRDDETGSSESSSSSSSGELFRGAALPRGMEKLRRVHQTYPGRIASRSLQRLQELLMNAQGRGTAFQEEENSQLPAVAVGYLTQVFFMQNPPQVVGMRSSKELRTIAHCIDLIARNDPLRALDVLVQRLKSIELAHLQGNWSQASQLELVMSDEQTATFRQEIKAAQLEVKADRSLNQDGRSTQRWRPWRPESTGQADPSRQEAAKDGDQPPENNQNRPRKGRGKGKKGGKKGYRW
jgi:hypothetical protein